MNDNVTDLLFKSGINLDSKQVVNYCGGSYHWTGYQRCFLSNMRNSTRD